jgi:hypothetical protein
MEVELCHLFLQFMCENKPPLGHKGEEVETDAYNFFRDVLSKECPSKNCKCSGYHMTCYGARRHPPW